jgi:hypothetical protein
MKPIYERLGKMSNKKLQKMAHDHQNNLLRFIDMRQSVTREIDFNKEKYKRCMTDALKELKSNVPKALGGGMRARLLKADITVAMSARSVIRMNEFYHRMMIILIEDILLGVNYNPDRVNNLVPHEFSDLVSSSISSTHFGDFLKQLKEEIEEDLQ